MFVIITLSEFLIAYAEVKTMISVRTDDITYPNLTVAEFLKNLEKYEDIMDQEISLIGVENNVMVIYL